MKYWFLFFMFVFTVAYADTSIDPAFKDKWEMKEIEIKQVDNETKTKIN